MSKIIFFDSGPIISLVMSRLVGILPQLKAKFQGEFYITPAVYRELIGRPLNIKRFEFEALQVLQLVNQGTIKIYSQVPEEKVRELITLANTSFSIQGRNMDIIQEGEMQSVACALQTKAQALVMDERTLCLLMENSAGMVNLLKSRFQNNVIANNQNITKFTKQISSIPVLRSLELVGVAYKMGLLDSYVPQQKDGRKVLLDAVLWAVKTNGCAATQDEIEDLKRVLL